MHQCGRDSLIRDSFLSLKRPFLREPESAMMMRGWRYQSTRQSRLVAVNLCGAASDLIRPALLRDGVPWVRTFVRPSFYG